MSTPKKEKKLSQSRFKKLTLLKRNFNDYPQSPDQAQLEVFDNAFPERPYTVVFDCPEYTSLCPVTNQPDFGHIKIEYIPNRFCIESKSLKLHLFSYRNHNTFHEEAVNLILDAVVKTSHPHYAKVTGVFNARGGIAISVQAEYGKKPNS